MRKHYISYEGQNGLGHIFLKKTRSNLNTKFNQPQKWFQKHVAIITFRIIITWYVKIQMALWVNKQYNNAFLRVIK